LLICIFLSTKGAYYGAKHLWCLKGYKQARKQEIERVLLLSMLAYIHKQAFIIKGCLMLAYPNKQAQIKIQLRTDRKGDVNKQASISAQCAVACFFTFYLGAANLLSHPFYLTEGR
jgi:hypothetical protein